MPPKDAPQPSRDRQRLSVGAAPSHGGAPEVDQQALGHEGQALMAHACYAEARPLLERRLALLEASEAPALLEAQLQLAALVLAQGELPRAAQLALAGLARARDAGIVPAEAFALAIEGLARVLQAEIRPGLDRLALALDGAQRTGEPETLIGVLLYWIEAQLHLGRHQSAADALAKAQALLRTLDGAEAPWRLESLAVALAVLTAAPDAGARTRERLRQARAAGRPAELAEALRWRAEWLLTHPEHGAASPLLDEASRLAEAAGLLLLAGELALSRSRLAVGAEAQTLAERSLMRGRETGCRLLEAQSLTQLAEHAPRYQREALAARQAIRAIAAALTPEAQAAYQAWPGRAALFLESAAAPGASRGFEHLARAIAALAAQPDLDALLRQAIAELVALSDAERGFLLLYDGFKVIAQISHGSASHDAESYSATLAYQVLWSGAPFFEADVRQHPALAPQQSIQDFGLRTVLGVPLLVGDEVIGVMLTDSQRINQAFGPADLALATALAGQIAFAIEAARKLEVCRRQAEEATLLHEIALAAAGANEPLALIGRIARAAATRLAAERTLWLRGPSLTCEAAFDADGRALPTSEQAFSTSVARWVYTHAQPLHLADAQLDEAFNAQHSIVDLGLRTVYAVPVGPPGALEGVLYCDNAQVVDAEPHALATLARMAESLQAMLARA